MATTAMFLALGGSSYAALRVTGSNVPTDALTGADIRDLTGRDVRDNSLTGADVKRLTGADVLDGSLRAADFAPGQLPRGPEGERGALGPQGERGADGRDATNLFGYIREASQSGGTASVEYGHGVAAVDDLADKGRYFVTFDRSVSNCVVLAMPGSGDPTGAVIGADGFAEVAMRIGPPEQVEVFVRDAAGAGIDTPFMIAAFC
jgi:hypothetical protein